MSKRINLVPQTNNIDYPDLLGLQLESFKKLFQVDSLAINRKEEELYKIFEENFPISDAKENFTIEFLGYSVEEPIYTPEECLKKDLTYSVAFKIKLRLISREEEKSKILDETIFLGYIPYMTPRGSFIINGKERVVVSQIHRSYGVFFSQTNHLSGAKIFFAKIIPLKGTWMEFITDIHKVMYAYIDRRKKFPITLILRALGYSKDEDILALFNLGEKIKTTREELEANKGRKIAGRLIKNYVEEFVDPETGEVISMARNEILLERDTILDDQSIQTVLNTEEKTIVVQSEQGKVSSYDLIYNTLKKDDTSSEKEAIEELYRQLRNAEPPDEEMAREFVNQLFFGPHRIYLGKVGRYSINKKLKLNIPKDIHILTKDDIIQTIKRLFNFINEKASSDDIDHLGNRRIRLVAEQLSDVLSVGVARMARTIREKMSVRVGEEFKPIDLVSTRVLFSAINSFFRTNPLSQLMDQINILGGVSHKRRLSSLGKGGISRERAGFEVRDVHYTHYGRVCPIETPDNLSIGLISSLAIHAKLDEMGFIQTPYKKIINGRLDLSEKVHYLTADEEDSHLIAQSTAEVDAKGNFLNEKLKVRQQGNFLLESPAKVTLIDVAKEQITSAAAGLIPFLEHDDANRALMASNMQRQAIPLTRPEPPIVGTGLEADIVKYCRELPTAEQDGIVIRVDANEIIIQNTPPKGLEMLSSQQTKTYKLKKLVATNQNTCINLKPLVSKGEHVKKGQLLCEGYGTQGGELTVGRNVRVAFVSNKGDNYEDAIVISEEVSHMFDSLHIYEFSAETTSTKHGVEKFTADIPSMSEAQLQNLDDNGIIAIGKKVKPGDVLVGKVTPKAQADLIPENVLLQAIFGEKAYNVKDTSLRAGPSFEGTVIDTQLFARHPRDKQTKEQIAKQMNLLKKATNKRLADLQQKNLKALTQLLANEKINNIYDKENNILISSQELITQEILQQKIFTTKEQNLDLDNAISIKHVNFNKWINNKSQAEIIKLLLENYLKNYNDIINNYKKQKTETEIGDDLPFSVLQRAKVRIAKKRKMQVGDKMAGRHGNKGIVGKIRRKEDMPYRADGTPIDILLSPLGIPSRMNIGQLYEAMLGLAGKKLGEKYAVKVFDAPGITKIQDKLKEAGLPDFGLTTLYDGFTGEPFPEKITCGNMYMLKLNHLVDEKIHARSTGPYALITQQPLGGRAQFGGQRLGEMEVDALKAYGAAHFLRESLSVKSDDIEGRKRAIRAIVKGENLPPPGSSEMFKIFRHQLRGLNIEVTCVRKNKPNNMQ